jgi:aspartyl-tRNA(Asn)/glutamyl-tRNA(Gln) amidotransferase subunit C
MKITPEEVRHIARLARLELTADEVTRFQVELSQILDYVAQLEDIESGASAEPPPPRQPLRQDVVEPCADPSALHRQAPDFVDGQFRVPRVVE